jgi:hypothetical protein
MTRSLRRGDALSVLALTLAFISPLSAMAGSGTDVVRVLEDMERAYAQVDSYTATSLVQERVQEELDPTHLIALKFKKPFNVYMRWLEGPHKGRQALFPVGADRNELLVRVPLLVGGMTLTLDPQSPRARRGGRHPITDVGIGRLLDFLKDNARRGLQVGDLRVEDQGHQMTFDRPTQRYVLRFPRDQAKGYYCMTAVVDVDREHRLPIYAEMFDWQDQIFERYGYRDLRLNAGLTDADFDPKHPDYGF